MVAPYAGAWIETSSLAPTTAICRVAPYAGAWIETYFLSQPVRSLGRSLCGSVD